MGENLVRVEMQNLEDLYILFNQLKKGEIITSNHVKSIRPGFGLPQKHLNDIVGKSKRKYIKGISC